MAPSTSLKHIAPVIDESACVEVVRVDAPPVVAVVKNAHSFRDFANEIPIRKSVCTVPLPQESELSISARKGRTPVPTSCRRVDLYPSSQDVERLDVLIVHSLLS